MASEKHSHPLIRLFGYARSYRRPVVFATLFSILNKLVDLAPPVLIGVAVDIVVQPDVSFLARLGIAEAESQLLVLAAITAVIWVLESVFEYLLKIIWRNLAQSIEHNLRIETYAHVQGLDLAYFEDQSTGGLMSVLNDDINQLERFLDDGANSIIQVITTVIAIGAMFYFAAPGVAWMALLPMPIIIWGSVRFQKALAPRYMAVREQVGILNGQLANNLGGIATIKSFTSEDHEIQRIREGSNEYRRRNKHAISFSSAFVPLIRMFIMAGFIAILVFGGRLALQGSLEIGLYSVMIFMTQRLLWPLTRLGEILDQYQRSMASTSRILDLLDTAPQIDDGVEPLPLSSVRGDVRFDQVSFSYRNGAQVLHGLNLHIPAGDTAAIVGATGAGKSTIIKLLLRFYDVTGGQITLDGQNLHDVRLRDLRSAIGLVSQDVYLFHGTVRDNIAYGTFDASMDAIIRAAKIAEAHDFIMALPEGYATIVGERGQKLSGGQRQRISIARAVLKDPPVLILDEATSSVDNETEAAIQRSLDRIIVDRTTIVIAHRLSTIRNADRIFVLEDGRLREQGRHEDLLQRGGIYRSLWRVQTGERLLATGDD
jgi:ATP-binding cassette subfamily B protein